jgi:hypothetical protein
MEGCFFFFLPMIILGEENPFWGFPLPTHTDETGVLPLLSEVPVSAE